MKRKYQLIKQREFEKQQKLLEARRELDKIKMKECTFKPKLNKTNKNSKISNLYYEDQYITNTDFTKNKILIKGLDRYYELKELAKEKEKEFQIRKDGAFNVNKNILNKRKKNLKGTLQTCPKPFNLSQNQHKKLKPCDKTPERGSYQRVFQKSKNRKKLFKKQHHTRIERKKSMIWKILQEDLINGINV